MTPQGTIITPSTDQAILRLLEAKYKIFKESIGIQLRWRQEIKAAMTPAANI
jgi:hypothetical protein